MIDQFTIDRIINAANIVDVVSDYVSLRKRGVNYIGLCPFHEDRTPSFYVSPAKNICKCFACGEGGTAVHFIMKHENLSYYDALRYLAKKYNIEIKERELSDEEKNIRNDRENMYVLNEWAKGFFSQKLYENEADNIAALRYFKERGFRDDTIKKFDLGYCPNQKDALGRKALQSGFNQKYLTDTGLCVARKDGTLMDRFRGRVMFPVHNLSGKIVAFGGRVLKKNEKTAKYVNSPESVIYHKSDQLYGLFHAKKAISKEDKCFLVEGYTDVISMHQAGIENVVASSGTALTQGQIKLIRRFTQNITVLYDGDAAGIKAALRGIDLLIEDGMNVKVLLLPDGEDPDSFARSHNATEFAEYIDKNETDFIRFKTKLLLGETKDPFKRAEVISDIIRTISLIPDRIIRTVYVQECASMMNIDVAILNKEVNTQISRRASADRGYGSPVGNTASPKPSAPTSTQAQSQPIGAEMPPPPPPTPEDYPVPPTQEDYPASSMPDNVPPPPPPLPEDEEAMGIPPAPSQEIVNKEVNRAKAVFERSEIPLIRYIVRYGEKILFEADEETGEPAISVVEYIHDDIARDDLQMQTPIFKQILNECYAKVKEEEGFVASKYLLYHEDSTIRKIAVNLLADKYQLSKYHSKFQKVETEEEQLPVTVPKDLYAFKEAYVMREIKRVQTEISQCNNDEDYEKILSLMGELSVWNNLKMALCKELGERIVLKM